MRYQYSILSPLTGGILSLAPLEEKTVGWFSPGNLVEDLHILAYYRNFLHRSVRAAHLWMICWILLQAFEQLVPLLIPWRTQRSQSNICLLSNVCPWWCQELLYLGLTFLNRVFQMATDCTLVDFPASSQPHRLVHLDGATMPNHGPLHM